MKGRKFLQQVVWVIVITLLLVGCGALASTPTSEPLPEYDPDTILVTFHGDGCTSSVPTELPVREYKFVVRDLSENNQDLWLEIGHLLDGHTYQDALDLQSEPGEHSPEPSWVDHPRKGLVGYNEPSDKVYTFYLEEEGEYFIITGGYNPQTLWLCGSFQVVEAPS